MHHSYVVKAIFTFVPVGPAISIIKNKLEHDKELQNRIHVHTTHNHIIGVMP